jgi:hypothetical protein
LFKRALVLLTALSLLVAMAVASNATVLQPPLATDLTYDDYLSGHLATPALKQAERFVAGQEKSGSRALQTGGDYGFKGCTAPEEYEVGATRTFWVSQQQAGNTEITAVLADKSPRGYMWVQQEFYLGDAPSVPEGGFVTQEEAQAGLEKWDTIYDINRTYFGTEPNPSSAAQNLAPGLPKNWRDADCDKRINILNFPIDAGTDSPGGYIAGYFSSEHEYPNGEGEHESPYSNEAEMFFMNSLFLNVGDDTYAGVLAHEFFHMIQFAHDYNEATWVNEGMADVAAVVNGFGDIVQGHIDAYLEEPDDHLFDWGGRVNDYGQAFLFFDYLFNHYGAPEVESTDRLEAYGLAKLLTRTAPDGDTGITKVLKSRSDGLLSKLSSYYGRRSTFKKVFRDYIVANRIDKPESSHGQFGYANRDVQAVTAGTGDASPADSTVHQYAAEYYEVPSDGTFSTSVQNPIAVIPASEGQPAPENGFFAWSNRADEMITYMQRRADLTDATAPSLSFKYWYQIEENWDYAYVRVSQDQGNTWDFINTSACGGVATDPNGNNRAIAESGGITGDSGGWKDCTLDLTTYAGGPVLVRFEYDTDQATTEAGYVVDNVKLVDGETKIWGTTKFERKPRAWKFGGDGLPKWMRIRPLAQNKPFIQMVAVSDDLVVRKVLNRKAFKSTADGLVLRTPRPLAGTQITLIFTGVTPIATDPFTYSYSIER